LILIQIFRSIKIDQFMYKVLYFKLTVNFSTHIAIESTADVTLKQLI